jgi:hypothetical protein
MIPAQLGLSFRRRKSAHDPREAPPEGSLPVSLQRLAAFERAAAARRSGDPWLILNMELFNFSGGWNQLLARQQAQQFTE